MKDDQKQDKKQEFLKLKEENERLKKELEENKNKYLRALSDYQNLEKRINEERKDWEKKIKKNIFLKILPIVDSLEKAEIFVKDPGLKLIKDQFLQFLKNEGIEEIDLLGKGFNPYLAEAVDIVLGDKDNMVVEILRKGYKLNEEILRVAQVKVSKKKVEKELVDKAKEQLKKGDYM